MNISARLADIRRTLLRRNGKGKQHKFHYEKISGRLRDQKTPWQDVLLAADLRPNDRALDMGCAEGHVSLEVAKFVDHVDGIEIDPARVNEANRIAAERGCQNVSFSVGSITDFALQPDAYDVSLLLHVLGKPTNSGFIGLAELQRMLVATKRQIIIRLDIQARSTVLRSISLHGILESAG